jgi:hypothetical protein
MPDDHSKSVPPLPIPNRTVKRYYADDSAATSVKVGYRQASYKEKTQQRCWVFFRLEKSDACARDGQGRHEPRCFFSSEEKRDEDIASTN